MFFGDLFGGKILGNLWKVHEKPGNLMEDQWDLMENQWDCLELIQDSMDLWTMTAGCFDCFEKKLRIITRNVDVQ